MMKKSPSDLIVESGMAAARSIDRLVRKMKRSSQLALIPIRGDALDRVASRSGTYWLSRANEAVRDIALVKDSLTSDDLRQELDCRGIGFIPEPNVIGAVMKIAARSGLITDTGRRTKSTRPQAHGREIRIWKSEVWNGAAGQN